METMNLTLTDAEFEGLHKAADKKRGKRVEVDKRALERALIDIGRLSGKLRDFEVEVV